MRQEAEVEARPPRQELRGELERDALDLRAEQVRQAHVAPGHQRQRRQEMFAELAIRHPRRAVLVRLERQGVDQDGAAVAELDVERRCVPERPPIGERFELSVERQERGVTQLPERPFVGVADELDRLGRDDRMGPGRLGELEGRRFVRQQPSALDQAPFEGAPREGIPFGREALLDLAVRATIAPEDEAAGIAEGARVTRRAGGRISRRGRRHPRTLGSMLPASASWRTSCSRTRRARAGPEQAGDLAPEEDGRGHDRGDGPLDDQAPGARVDVCEFEAEHVAPDRAHGRSDRVG